MPQTPASVTNTFATRSGKIRLSLLDTDYNDLTAYLNTLLNYSNYVVDSGAADAYVATFDGGLTFGLTAGQLIQLKIVHANTGACTLAVNGGAAKSIKMQDGSDPAANTLVANGLYGLIYTGTVWMLLGETPGSTTAAAVAAIAAAIGVTVEGYDATILKSADIGSAVEGYDATILKVASPVLQTIWIPGAAMFPSIAPLSPPNAFAVARNQGVGTEATVPQFVNVGLAIDQSVQFCIAFPKGWDLGTITFRPYWTIPVTGAITGTKAKFQLAGVALADNEDNDENFGTAIGVEQVTVAPTGYRQYIMANSAALTIANTPADGSLCFFKVQRVAASSSDITADLALLGIKINYTATLSDA